MADALHTYSTDVPAISAPNLQSLNVLHGHVSTHDNHDDPVKIDAGERMTSWVELQDDLAAELPVLGELDTMFWEANGRCVQLQQTRLDLCMSVISNEHLLSEHALTEAEEVRLWEIGWHEPGLGMDSWHLEMPWPITTGQAQQAAKMLREAMELVLLVSSPNEINYRRTTAYIGDPRRRLAMDS